MRPWCWLGTFPFITPGHLRELVDACRGAGLPATSSDGQGKTQFLCAAWPRELLLSLLAEVGDPVDAAVRHLYAGVETIRVDVAPGIIADFDTAEELIVSAPVSTRSSEPWSQGSERWSASEQHGFSSSVSVL